MKNILNNLTPLLLLLLVAVAHADTSAIAIDGYDLVSYQQNNGSPVKGNRKNIAYHEGNTYVFSSAENKATFEGNPSKYVPAYGGYCAFGLTKGKKFLTDPLAYKVVNGTLYLNFNKNVQELWVKNHDELIKEANTIWKDIKHKHPSEL